MRSFVRSFVSPFVAAGLACALAACGGGGGGTTPHVGGSTGGSTGGSGSGTTSTGTAAATLSVALQQYAPVQTTSVKRRVAFISPATASISLNVVSVNGTATTGTPQTFTVGPTAPNCGSTSGIVNCSLSASLPIGTDVLSASTLDSNGHTLGTSQIQATIAQNATNVVPLAVGGTIASLEIFLSHHTFTPGTPGTANVIVVPLDSSGAAIVNPGNYSPAITVTNSGSTHFSLITDGGTPAQSGTINSPDDQVVLSFDGNSGSGTTTITAAAGTGVTPATTNASFTASSLAATPSGANFNATSSYIFTMAGQMGTIIASGGTPPYTITTSDPTVATVGGTSPNFTAAAVGYGTAGTATITVTDSATPTAATTTIPVTFIAPAVSLSATSCAPQATCTANSVSGAPGPTMLVASGGTGTYSYLFASSGTTSSAYATVTQTGNHFTLTPNGAGNDALLVGSGNQVDYFAIISNKNALVSSLPAAFGFIIGDTAPTSVGSASETISSCSLVTGTLNGFSTTPGSPGSVSANAASPSHGTITCVDNLGYTATVPFSVFSIDFGTYQGLNSVNNPSATAVEAFTASNEMDSDSVVDPGGSLASVTSGNTGIVTVALTSSTTYTVTSAGAGFTTITLTDSTGASVSYSVSVTTTTIPVASKTRLTR